MTWTVGEPDGRDAVKIAFVSCDEGHARPGSFLRLLIETALARPSVVVAPSSGDADVILASSSRTTWELARRGLIEMGFRLGLSPNPQLRAKSRLVSRRRTRNSLAPHVWFTLENIRPPAEGWDATFSFDLDPMGGMNTYLPLWWHLMDFFEDEGIDHYLGRRLRMSELLAPRSVSFSERPRFACAFINHPEPTRLRTIAALERIGPVDVYGALTGRLVASKLEVASRYRFVIGLENDLYPGYVTEKPIEAWATGAIPIWWGDDAAGYLNESAMLNLAEVGSLQSLCDQVSAINANADAWERVASRPILRRRPDIAPALQVIRDVIGE